LTPHSLQGGDEAHREHDFDARQKIAEKTIVRGPTRILGFLKLVTLSIIHLYLLL
jgi:hypothetical protein